MPNPHDSRHQLTGAVMIPRTDKNVTESGDFSNADAEEQMSSPVLHLRAVTVDVIDGKLKFHTEYFDDINSQVPTHSKNYYFPAASRGNVWNLTQMVQKFLSIQLHRGAVKV